MDSQLFQLLLLALLGSVAGLVGGVIFLVSKKSANFLSRISTPLAAGVLLSLSLLDLLPEAVEISGMSAFYTVLIAFIAIFLVERLVFPLHHHEGDHSHKQPVSLVILGDTIHNFLDGVAIAAGFMVSPSLGLFVALGAFLHETPHEIADFGILLKAGWGRGKAFWTNFVSALATIPGALLTFYYSNKVESGVGILLAVAAGLFLYIAATDFLPDVAHDHGKKGSRWEQVFYLIVGVIAIVGLKAFFPEVGQN